MPPTIPRSLRQPASSSNTPAHPDCKPARTWRGLAAALTCSCLVGLSSARTTQLPPAKLTWSGCSPAGTYQGVGSIRTWQCAHSWTWALSSGVDWA
ncbi:hypothetical protein SORBI_3004G291600 [Sorghum bicolor]|uniref:Uncharacterized protein n=1 Tax=Sorghum bicolor TaxID=4558 RepID=A0A194YS99_SORBI|nr:hypothetical protein SORBI_3004G291600 [Sorghum bicolor]